MTTSHKAKWRKYLACGGLGLTVFSLALWNALTPTRYPAQHWSQDTIQSTQIAANRQEAPPQALTSASQSESSEKSATSTSEPHDDESAPKWTDIITAIAAFGSFAFTGALWISTRALWIETKRLASGAETQRTDFLRSIEAAKKGAEATRDSVVAAQRSAKAAEEAGYRDRAWVCLDAIHTYSSSNIGLNGAPPQNGILITARWKNSGKTPATDGTSRIDFKIIGLGEPIPKFAADLEPQKSVIGPESIIYSKECFIPLSDVHLIMQRRKVLVIHSRVEYRDIFENAILRISEVTAVSNYAGQKTEDGITTPRWINTFRGDQNRST